MPRSLEEMIHLLGLTPHPEGGFYRETFRSARMNGGRNATTAIYFLIPAGSFSAFHVLRDADEIWHHYDGDPVEIHTIASDGEHRARILGKAVGEGERPQLLVPAGTLQAAVPRGDGFALCGCTVTPGFDFGDFHMPDRDELLRHFPRHEGVIRKLSRS